MITCTNYTKLKTRNWNSSPETTNICLLKRRKTGTFITFLELTYFACRPRLHKHRLFTFCSPKAFTWLSIPKIFTIKACAEFYCRQIARKFSLKLPQPITYLGRLIYTSLLLFFGRLRVPSALFNQLIQPQLSPARRNSQIPWVEARRKT